MQHLVPVVVITIVLIALIRLTWKRTRPSVESYFVANRTVPLTVGIVTLSANWIQAPAILNSGVLAYQSGYHFLAFFVPNVIALILPAFLVPRIQAAIPNGYTVPQFMGTLFGSGVRTLYYLSALGAMALAVAYTFSGLRQWFSLQLGIQPWELYVALVFMSLLVLPRGLPSALMADVGKWALILIGALGAGSLVFYNSMPIQAFTVLDAHISPLWIAWTLGVTLSASLIGGPICNPDLGERMYAVDTRIVRNAYLLAAGFFAIVVLAFGALGFLAKHLGIPVDARAGEIPALVLLQKTMPESVVYGVTVGLLLIFAAALASLLTSAGNLNGIELYRRFIRPNATETETIWWSRGSMLIPIIGGMYVANLPQVNLTVLLQSMAVVRGEAIVPILCAVFWPKREYASFVFWGMICASIIGVTLTFYHPTPFLQAHGRSLGALAAVFVPLLAWCLAVWRSQKNVTPTCVA